MFAPNVEREKKKKENLYQPRLDIMLSINSLSIFAKSIIITLAL